MTWEMFRMLSAEEKGRLILAELPELKEEAEEPPTMEV